MTRNKPEPVLIAPPYAHTMKMFANALNAEVLTFPFPGDGSLRIERGDSAAVKQELLRLVQAWFDSGPNVEKLWAENPAVAQLPHMVLGILLPTTGGRVHLIPIAGPGKSGRFPGSPLEIALGLFLPFLLNPYNETLGGPCKHCGKYYVKNTKRQVVYCSQQCGRKHTSKTAIQKQRLQQHQEKLQKARHYSEKWAQTKTSKGWKEWISDSTQISKHWISRSAKNGDLIEPVRRTTVTRRS